MFIKSTAWKWHRIICTSLFNSSFEYLVCPCYNISSPIHHFPILTLTITYNCFSKQILHITYLFKVSDMHLHFHFLLYTSVFPSFMRTASLVPVYSFTLNKYLTSVIFILPFFVPQPSFTHNSYYFYLLYVYSFLHKINSGNDLLSHYSYICNSLQKQYIFFAFQLFVIFNLTEYSCTHVIGM